MSDEPRLEPAALALPAKFTMRRIFSFGTSITVLAMLWIAVSKLDNEHLASVCKWLIGMNMVVIIMYMAAPTAEQIVRIVKAAASYRGPISRTAESGSYGQYGGGYGGYEPYGEARGNGVRVGLDASFDFPADPEARATPDDPEGN